MLFGCGLFRATVKAYKSSAFVKQVKCSFCAGAKL
jgi:hypothetical protein